MVSLFIDADRKQIDAAKETGAPVIEIHTGHYADALTLETSSLMLEKIIDATNYASEIGLQVNAGHGLNLQNITPVAKIPIIEELNIGHAIIADSVFMGLSAAVKAFKESMLAARV